MTSPEVPTHLAYTAPSLHPFLELVSLSVWRANLRPCSSFFFPQVIADLASFKL